MNQTRAREWAAISAAACAADPAPTLRGWRPVGSLVRRGGSGGASVTILLSSGVPLADLTTYATTLWPQIGVDDHAAFSLSQELATMGGYYPDMTVHAALGWVLLTMHRYGEHADDFVAVDEAAFWVQEGHAERGWLFEAAGLDPFEVDRLGMSADGGGDADAWDGVWLLAGLSGIPLPSGVSSPVLVPAV